MGDNSEKARIRFSFDAGAAAAEYDALSRSASSMEPECPCACASARRPDCLSHRRLLVQAGWSSLLRFRKTHRYSTDAVVLIGAPS